MLFLLSNPSWCVSDFFHGFLSMPPHLRQNFLRSVLGEARLANLIIPPPSAFMKLLQNTLDRADWSETGQLRTLASAVQDVATRPPMLDEQSFPFRTWWKDLPQAIKDIPEDWTPFSLADEVIQSGLDRLEVSSTSPLIGSPESPPRQTLHGAYDLNDNLRQLANELQGLQAECEASGSRLNDIEEELGKRLAESLAQL